MVHLARMLVKAVALLVAFIGVVFLFAPPAPAYNGFNLSYCTSPPLFQAFSTDGTFCGVASRNRIVFAALLLFAAALWLIIANRLINRSEEEGNDRRANPNPKPWTN